jgi:hypothetical protein
VYGRCEHLGGPSTVLRDCAFGFVAAAAQDDRLVILGFAVGERARKI